MFDSFIDWFINNISEAGIEIRCTFNMLIGAAVGIYIRELHRRCSSSLSSREFSDVFPMLTSLTVVIIFVVKSSLPLSLGLVGALSIVRFRAAIKTAEELVFLFFCIGVGLVLGAEYRVLALITVVVVTMVILVSRFLRRKAGRHNLLLTITGEAERFFSEGQTTVVDTLSGLIKRVNIQRFDLEDGQVQFRASVSIRSLKEISTFMSEIRRKLPGFEVSYLNLDSLL